MNIQTALIQACEKLSGKTGSERLDAELLLAKVLQKNRTYLATWPEREIEDPLWREFTELVERRTKGEPIAYILGEQGFWSLTLKTLPHTLIPRPDTETLVEWVLELSQQLPDKSRVLDLGTGTGAIVLALAREFPNWSCVGCDFVAEAVALAEDNAELNGIHNVEFRQSDWFQKVEGSFDLIVSNPPYIDPDDEHLSQGDVRFEPLSALIAEEKGLADLRHIIDNARAYLNTAGWLLVEHGYDQEKQVQKLFQASGFHHVRTQYDYGGNPRITGGQYLLK